MQTPSITALLLVPALLLLRTVILPPDVTASEVTRLDTGVAHTGLADDASDALATLRAVFAAAERGDMLALDSLYDGDSLTVVEGAGINRGWADYRDHHLGPEVKAMKNFFYRPVDIDVHVVATTAWLTFRYNLKADMNGRAIDNVGRGTAILVKRTVGSNSRWVVRHIQTSSRARRPTDPPAT